MAESEEKLKNCLMKLKEKSEKAGLKLNIQKTKIVSSGPITSWQIDGGKWKKWQTLSSWAPKITADSDCHHETKRCLLLGRKAMTNPDNILRNRHHFADKGPYNESYGFSSSHVQMWELDHKEGWAVKNWCFQIVVLRRHLRVPWTGRRSNQSIIKEIILEYSLEQVTWSWSSNALAT